MTWIKICGTTNLEDALLAVDAGADAVGFVFYEKSPRNVSVETAREIVEKLPDAVEKVGVFVESDEIDPLKIYFEVGLTGLQAYLLTEMSARPESRTKAVGMARLPPRARFLPSLSANLLGESLDGFKRLGADFAKLGKNPPKGFSPPERILDTFVLDSGNLRQPGGTGQTFNWRRAVPIAEGLRQSGLKLVVAGGLTPNNVSEAMEILQPWGVDVVSGVETRPGKKDPEKVRAFVKAVRDRDRD